MAIVGSGVAASCCAHLLRGAGFPLSLTDGARPRVPAILIGENTQALVRDVYGQPDLLHGLYRIDRRVVAWGRHADPVELPHRAAVISEEALLEQLGLEQLGPAPEAGTGPESTDWTIYASQRSSSDSNHHASLREHEFGARTASATAVALKPSQGSACWIESLEEGWIFLVPDSPSTGWLIAVGAGRDSLLAQSRVIAEQIQLSGLLQSRDCEEAGTGNIACASDHPQSRPFRAYPRIVDPLCAPGWLACGSAAMAFDPLCGDGIGAAIRESILAAAVIRASHAGERSDGLLAHYRGRLIGGLLRHLELCRTFYVSANCGPWWERELAALEEGIAWCKSALPAGGAFQYRLRGFELERIA